MPSKLIRDKIPAIARDAGQILDIRTADRTEMAGLLRDKLVEEAAEAAAASPDTLLEELADVLEVVYTLGRLHGWGPREISLAKLRKALQRGEFTKGYVLTTPEPS
ncbi:hypothetical protein ACFWIB_14580 [Streptomyces sp. NPDC127051]|uniref:hypothetical protein n=1 Tax=Streptomyces sp. NPDC127051 TaxID=3347119 RepID=UPI00365EB7C3